MASLKSTITLENELRPCYVENKRALFHRWFERRAVLEGGETSFLFAVVEFENGRIELVHATMIKFADGGKFGETMFLPEE